MTTIQQLKEAHEHAQVHYGEAKVEYERVWVLYLKADDLRRSATRAYRKALESESAGL